MANLVGQDIGRYHITEQLGQGGMAIVYKAYDTRLERDVALKIIRKGAFGEEVLGRILKRFEREARALAKLHHPHIIGIIDYGMVEELPYMVMPYYPGRTLKEYIGKPMAYPQAAALLEPIARALAYAHQQKILHRDVKPANILLDENGIPMLSDFGIARILEFEEGSTLTGTGVGIGTPEYMAPEQWHGNSYEQSDLYALGVVFYELLTGRKPYSADTPAAVAIKQASDPLPRPDQYVPDLPQEVTRLILKALARDPQDRYASMSVMADALANLAVSAQGQPVLLPGIDQRPDPDQVLTRDDVEPIQPEKKGRLLQSGRSGFSKITALLVILIPIVLVGLLVWGGGNKRSLPAAETETPPPTASVTLPAFTETSLPSQTPTETLTPRPTWTARPTSTPIDVTQYGCQSGDRLLYHQDFEEIDQLSWQLPVEIGPDGRKALYVSAKRLDIPVTSSQSNITETYMSFNVYPINGWLILFFRYPYGSLEFYRIGIEMVHNTFDLGYRDANDYFSNLVSIPGLAKNQWHKVEIVMNNADRNIQVRVDGKPAIDYPVPQQIWIAEGRIGFYASENHGAEVWLDDIVVCGE